MITLSQARELFRGRRGNLPHIETLRRWVRDGRRVRGGVVRLWAAEECGRWWTTAEAVERFKAECRKRPAKVERLDNKRVQRARLWLERRGMVVR